MQENKVIDAIISKENNSCFLFQDQSNSDYPESDLKKISVSTKMTLKI